MFKTLVQLIRLSVRQQLTYRVAMLGGLATNLFFGILRAAVMVGLYAGRSEVNQMTLQDSITFVALSQSLIAYLSIFGWAGLLNTVYDGSIAADLLKPTELYLHWMGRSFGAALVNLVTRGVFFMLLFPIFYPVSLPPTLEAWLTLPLSLFFSWLVIYSIQFLTNLASFWSPDARGVLRLVDTLISLFSGFLIPLRLFPDWFSQICNLLPFASIINTPIEVYLGLLSGKELWLALGVQLVWFVALAGLCQITLRAGVRRLVIQGG